MIMRGQRIQETTIKNWARPFLLVFVLLLLFVPQGALSAQSAEVTIRAYILQPLQIVPIGPQTIGEGQTLSITFVALYPDIEHPLTYNVQLLPEGSVLPTGVSLQGNLFSWTPGFDQAGIYIFRFSVDDGLGNVVFEDVTITVGNVNNPPIAVDDGVSTGENAGTIIVALANDYDPNGDPILIISVTPPAHGTAVISADSLSILYTPNAEYSGPDSFTYTITDGAFTATATVAVTVTAVNDPPEFPQPEDKTINENTAVTFRLVAFDPNGDEITYGYATPLPEGASLNTVTGEFSWKPTYLQAGTYTIDFFVSDGHPDGTVIRTITITVLDPLPTFFTNPQIIANGQTQRVKIGEILDPDSYFTTCEVPAEHQDICSLCEIDADGGIYLTCTPPSGGQGTTQSILITIRDPLHGITLPTVTIPLSIWNPSAVPVEPRVRPTEPGVYIPGPPAFMLPSGKLIPRTTVQDLGGGNYLLTVYDDEGNIIGKYIITGEVHKILKKYGKVSVFFRFERGNCQNLTRIKTEILEEFDTSIQQQIRDVVDEAGYEVKEMPFIVDITIEPPCTTGNSSMFLTVNATWIFDEAGWDLSRCATIPPNTVVPNIGIAHLTDQPDGSSTSEYLSILTNESACPDAENNIKLRVDASHLSIYGMVSVKAKETAGVTTAANPDVEPMLVPGGVGLEAYLAENPALIGGVVALLVIVVVLEGKFHILRRKEHKHLEHPEGGPPAWEGLIETDQQKALSAIIGVLNDVDVQLKDLDRTMAKRAPAFVFAAAEADAIVEKFFYTCQVAEEKIKSAAAEEHISQKQIDHLNGQLKDAVDRMIAVSQKSPVLAQAVQARMGTGTAAAGGET
jgi:hypothetical protein